MDLREYLESLRVQGGAEGDRTEAKVWWGS